MARYTFTESGQVYSFDHPLEDLTPDEVNMLKPMVLQKHESFAAPRRGILNALTAGIQQGVGSAAQGAGRWAGLEGLEKWGKETAGYGATEQYVPTTAAEAEKGTTMDKLRYGLGGYGLERLAHDVGGMAVPLVAGAVNPVAGMAAWGGMTTPQAYIGGVQRQEQLNALQGQPGAPIDEVSAQTNALIQGTIATALGPVLGAMGGIGKTLIPGLEKALGPSANEMAKRIIAGELTPAQAQAALGSFGTQFLRNAAGATAVGAAMGGAGVAGQEIQAGESPVGAEAMHGYKDVLASNVLMAGPFGAHGAYSRRNAFNEGIQKAVETRKAIDTVNDIVYRSSPEAKAAEAQQAAEQQAAAKQQAQARYDELAQQIEAAKFGADQVEDAKALNKYIKKLEAEQQQIERELGLETRDETGAPVKLQGKPEDLIETLMQRKQQADAQRAEQEAFDKQSEMEEARRDLALEPARKAAADEQWWILNGEKVLEKERLLAKREAAKAERERRQWAKGAKTEDMFEAEDAAGPALVEEAIPHMPDRNVWSEPDANGNSYVQIPGRVEWLLARPSLQPHAYELVAKLDGAEAAQALKKQVEAAAPEAFGLEKQGSELAQARDEATLSQEQSDLEAMAQSAKTQEKPLTMLKGMDKLGAAAEEAGATAQERLQAEQKFQEGPFRDLARVPMTERERAKADAQQLEPEPPRYLQPADAKEAQSTALTRLVKNIQTHRKLPPEASETTVSELNTERNEYMRNVVDAAVRDTVESLQAQNRTLTAAEKSKLEHLVRRYIEQYIDSQFERETFTPDAYEPNNALHDALAAYKERAAQQVEAAKAERKAEYAKPVGSGKSFDDFAAVRREIKQNQLMAAQRNAAEVAKLAKEPMGRQLQYVEGQKEAIARKRAALDEREAINESKAFEDREAARDAGKKVRDDDKRFGGKEREKIDAERKQLISEENDLLMYEADLKQQRVTRPAMDLNAGINRIKAQAMAGWAPRRKMRVEVSQGERQPKREFTPEFKKAYSSVVEKKQAEAIQRGREPVGAEPVSDKALREEGSGVWAQMSPKERRNWASKKAFIGDYVQMRRREMLVEEAPKIGKPSAEETVRTALATGEQRALDTLAAERMREKAAEKKAEEERAAAAAKAAKEAGAVRTVIGGKEITPAKKEAAQSTSLQKEDYQAALDWLKSSESYGIYTEAMRNRRVATLQDAIAHFDLPAKRNAPIVLSSVSKHKEVKDRMPHEVKDLAASRYNTTEDTSKQQGAGEGALPALPFTPLDQIKSAKEWDNLRQVVGQGGVDKIRAALEGGDKARISRLNREWKAKLQAYNDALKDSEFAPDTRFSKGEAFTGDGEVRIAEDALQEHGIGHLVDGVTHEVSDKLEGGAMVRLNPDGTAHITYSKELMTEGGAHDIQHHARHEYGHILDRKGNYSDHEMLRGTRQPNGSFTPVGSVMREVVSVRNGNKNPLLSKYFDYPLGKDYNHLTSKEVQEEIFAQLHALYTEGPTSRAILKQDMPAAHDFIEGVIHAEQARVSKATERRPEEAPAARSEQAVPPRSENARDGPSGDERSSKGHAYSPEVEEGIRLLSPERRGVSDMLEAVRGSEGKEALKKAALFVESKVANAQAPHEHAMRLALTKGTLAPKDEVQSSLAIQHSNSLPALVASALNNGAARLVKTEEGNRWVTPEAGDNAPSLLKAVKELPKGIDENLVAAIARARHFNKVGWEKWNTADEGKRAAAQAAAPELIQMIDKTPGLREYFDTIAAMNHDMIKGLVDSGYISAEEAAKWHPDTYTPAYREMGDGTIMLDPGLGKDRIVRIGNIKDFPQLKELVGGKQELLPYFEGLARNVQALTTVSVNNYAKKTLGFMYYDLGIAHLGGKKASGDNVLHFRVKGVERAMVFDRDIAIERAQEALRTAKTPAAKDAAQKRLDTLDAANYISLPSLVSTLAGAPVLNPSAIKALSLPARVLHGAITRNPLYPVMQLVRDIPNAIIMQGADPKIALKTITRLAAVAKGTDKTANMLSAAGVGLGQHALLTSGAGQAERQLLKIQQAKSSGIKSMIQQMGVLADHYFGSVPELAMRASLYESAKEKGMTDAEALRYTLEVGTNFGKRGSSTSLYVANMLTPFINSQIRGWDTARMSMMNMQPGAARTNAFKNMATRGMMLALASVAYHAAWEDDEDYRNESPEARAGNIYFKIDGHMMKIPIPFETGVLFKALPEALATLVADKHGIGEEEFWKMIRGQIISQVFPGGGFTAEVGGVKAPVPTFGLPGTAMKPLLDMMTGVDTRTGIPIESAQMKKLQPGYRSDTRTSEFAKAIGEEMDISPKQIDSAISSYFSTLGVAVADLTARAVGAGERPGVEKPEKPLEQSPWVARVFADPYKLGELNVGFEGRKAVSEAEATYKELIKDMRYEDAQAYFKAHPQIAFAEAVNQLAKMQAEAKSQVRLITNAPGMSAEEKRLAIEKIVAYQRGPLSEYAHKLDAQIKQTTKS